MFEHIEDALWHSARRFRNNADAGTRERNRPDNWPKNTEIVWKDFVVPENILDKTAAVPDSPKARILNLPVEIILEIFSRMSRMNSICLALTCKPLLRVSRLAICHRPTLPLENRIPFSDFEGSLFLPINPEHHTRRLMIAFLFRIHPIREGGRPSMGVHLCRDCLRYRSTKASWWVGKGEPCPMKTTFRSKWDIIVERWSEKLVLQCPECWYLHHISVCDECQGRDGTGERQEEARMLQ